MYNLQPSRREYLKVMHQCAKVARWMIDISEGPIAIYRSGFLKYDLWKRLQKEEDRQQSQKKSGSGCWRLKEWTASDGH